MSHDNPYSEICQIKTVIISLYSLQVVIKCPLNSFRLFFIVEPFRPTILPGSDKRYQGAKVDECTVTPTRTRKRLKRGRLTGSGGYNRTISGFLLFFTTSKYVNVEPLPYAFTDNDVLIDFT